MSLSRNDMLTTGGNRQQRSRGSVRVSEPSFGFFVTGSSIEAMNGVYVRRNPPKRYVGDAMPPTGAPALYYKHEENVWTMTLNELPKDTSKGDDEEEEDDDDYHYYRSQHKKKPKTHAWFFIDGLGKERFTHDGDTIVPGAGTRWKHVPASGFVVDAESSSDEESSLYGFGFGRRRTKKPSASAAASSTSSSSASSTALTAIAPPDEEELPWQVIAILDQDMVQQLLYSSSHRKEKVRASMAGKSAAAAPPKSIECAFSPGRWLFKVASKTGVFLRTTASEEGASAGIRQCGEYMSGAELGPGADGTSLWLRLEVDEDREVSDRRGSRGYYDYSFSRRALWVCVEGPGGEKFLEELSNVETPVLDLKNVGDTLPSTSAASSSSSSASAQDPSSIEPDGGASLIGDLFDRPFIPRMGDENNSADADGATHMLLLAVRGSVDDGVVSSVEAQAKQASRDRTSIVIPPGEAVTIIGLSTLKGLQYNGVNGVVVTSSDSEGRQGIRLHTPFSGKVLSLNPSSLTIRTCEADEDEDIIAAKDEASKALARAARLLNVRLSRLGLSAPSAASASGGAWGFGGDTPVSVVMAAVRAAIRELGQGNNSPAALSSIYSAGDLLRAATPTHPFAPLSSCARSPAAALRSGCLGVAAAAATAAAVSPASSTERAAGTKALREMLRSEFLRSSAAKREMLRAAGDEEENGVDELLFRLALTEALLEDRRDFEAKEEARDAVRKLNLDQSCPPAFLLLGRCLLRQGVRAEGLTALETAEKWGKNKDMGSFPLWLKDLWEWSTNEAGRLLVVHRAAESARTSAVEAYARGSFQDASLLYGRSITLLKVGFPDDKRGRATAHSDKAGCLRRDRKLDAAIADLDAALLLFPRFSRAIFRRSACLLEKGDAEGAIEGFKALYRVERGWPSLSDWLVRAFTLQKRQKQGYKGGDRGNFDETRPSSASGTPGANSANASEKPEATKIAAEVDHYAVLGVSTDATEKQLKTAYRMMSLKFHPDKPTGDTAAFQRIADAYQTLSDPEKRRAFDEGVDIKVKRGRKDEDDDSEEEDEEHKTTMKEEVEREFYPERYHFWPFGDPFIYKRKYMAQKAAKAAKESGATGGGGSKPAWQEDGGDDW